MSYIFGLLDCSSGHIYLEILGVGSTGTDLSMVTALLIFAPTNAFAITDLTVS